MNGTTAPSTAREHAEKARSILEVIRGTGVKLTTDQMLQAAQVHATLALVESSRTVNMIAFANCQYSLTDDLIRRIDN